MQYNCSKKSTLKKTMMPQYVNRTTRQRIIESIKIGTTLQDVRKQFDITEGSVIEVLRELGMYATPAAEIGHKNQPYFEGDFPPETPKYSVKDLTGDEKIILQSQM